MVDLPQIIDSSLIITALGIITYVYGRIISDATPQKEERFSSYILGGSYLIAYILFPIVLVYAIITQDISKLNCCVIVGVIVQSIIVFVLTKQFQGLNSIRRLNLIQFTKEAIIKKSSEVLKGSVLEKGTDVNKSVNTFEMLFLKNLTPLPAFIINLIMVGISFYVLTEDIGIIYKFISILFTFLTTIFVAFNINFKEPQDVEIVLEKGESIKGKLNKVEDGYVTIFCDNKILNINKDKIIMLKREAYNQEKLAKILDKK